MTGNLNLPPTQLMVRGGSFMATKRHKNHTDEEDGKHILRLARPFVA